MIIVNNIQCQYDELLISQKEKKSSRKLIDYLKEKAHAQETSC